VRNDNPYESQFKTLKHCPAVPGQFGSIQDASILLGCSSATTTMSTATPASLRL
jgi:hypothetical protein